jgi:hypothetical protein
MKNLKPYIFPIIILCQIITAFGQSREYNFTGAWQTENAVIIFSGDYFSYAAYNIDLKTFEGTYGGKWSYENGSFIQFMEFNTFDKALVGQKIKKKLKFNDDKIFIDEVEFNRIDDGHPGKLEGAWLFSGRKLEGEIQTRDTNQPRKTMKILSGTRFQWIAYNVETGVFSGTGGGTYTTENGQYTEHIDFFSRDNSRVGASLSFDYELIDGVWNHSGLNSRGEPLYEFWSLRK